MIPACRPTASTTQPDPLPRSSRYRSHASAGTMSNWTQRVSRQFDRLTWVRVLPRRLASLCRHAAMGWQRPSSLRHAARHDRRARSLSRRSANSVSALSVAGMNARDNPWGIQPCGQRSVGFPRNSFPPERGNPRGALTSLSYRRSGVDLNHRPPQWRPLTRLRYRTAPKAPFDPDGIRTRDFRLPS